MRKYSGKQISRAGDVLTEDNIAETNPAAFADAMEILSYWRAYHDEPLGRAVELLTQIAQKYDQHAVIAKRLKRTPSIVSKLRRFTGMKLRSMQDIGGCRAILANEKRVRKLVRELKLRKDFKIRDYISTPKEDGYRSIHMVGDFSDGHGSLTPIELQIRTAAQHSWATSVEIIDLFTGEAIKADRGSEEWRSFFRSAADQFALIEDIPLYNQINRERLIRAILFRLLDDSDPERQKQAVESSTTLFRLGDKLGILDRFQAYAHSLKAADDHITKGSDPGYVLLEVDLKKNEVSLRALKKDNFSVAANAYLEAEKRAATSSGLVVALVSTDAVGGIKEAYPNYFADSTLFTEYISAAIEAYKRYNPSALGRAIVKLFPPRAQSARRIVKR